MADSIAEQRRLYGAPIGDLVRHVTGGLRLTQSRVAATIGLSPAMLSQLMSGHRVKIGNPQAVSRLRDLLALADEAPDLTQASIDRRLEEIRASRTALTTGQTTVVSSGESATIRRALRAVASGRELEQAARALADVSPGLAELIRIHGTGTPADADRHYASISHLL